MAAHMRSTRPSCHYGPIPIFQVGKATLWGGSFLEVHNEPRPWALHICCAGHSYAPSDCNVFTSISTPHAIQALSDETEPFISIDWPDGGLPPVKLRFWRELTEALKEVRGDVSVYCFGGHGRTGTALSIIAALSGAVPDGEDPVQWLRDRYCKEAVETTEQCRYIELVTERDVTATPSLMLSRDWSKFLEDFNKKHGNDLEDSAVETNAAGDLLWLNGISSHDDHDFYDDYEAACAEVDAEVEAAEAAEDIHRIPLSDLRNGLKKLFQRS